jgi:hypothetical protein
MDLRQYFRRIREIESNMPDAHVFVTSLETPDGGKPGVVTEVPREVAAKMITEGRALLSTKAEKEQFLEDQKAARAAAQRSELAQRLQVTVVTESEASRAGNPPDPTQRPAAKK